MDEDSRDLFIFYTTWGKQRAAEEAQGDCDGELGCQGEDEM